MTETFHAPAIQTKDLMKIVYEWDGPVKRLDWLEAPLMTVPQRVIARRAALPSPRMGLFDSHLCFIAIGPHYRPGDGIEAWGNTPDAVRAAAGAGCLIVRLAE